MPKRSSNEDENQIAARVLEALQEPTTKTGKNPAAVALGRLGGLKGGKARAEKLSPRKRKQIAKKAAKARAADPPPVALHRDGRTQRLHRARHVERSLG